jgi:hypothetical protein
MCGPHVSISRRVSYSHRRNLVHHNLNPQNILVKFDESGPGSLMLYRLIEQFWTAKVCDFGTWWKKMDMHLNMMMREPERIHSMKTEVYSFALACFVVLTSESTTIPFKEVRDHSVKASKGHVQRGKRLELPPNCPFYLSDLVHEIWFGNPVKEPNFDCVSTERRHIKEFLLTSYIVSSV